MADFKSKKIPVSIAILAGGKSSRMGQNKALMTYEGKTFLERLIEEFSDFDEILVSVREEKVYDLGRYSGKIKLVSDENLDKGPLEGIRRSLAKTKNDFIFVCAADMPFLTKAVPEYLTEFFCSDYECYVPVLDSRAEPLCAVYKKSVFKTVENQMKTGDLKLSHLFESVSTKFIPIEKSLLDKKNFVNVNTPEEYSALKKPFIFAVSGIKNSGKTRMILLLIEEIKRRGYTCAVIKHDGHDCFSDAPGTDTARFAQAGALAAGVYSDKRFLFNAGALALQEETVTEKRLINQILSLPAVPDFIILEGLKDSAYPKVEVLRSGVSEKSLCKEPVICIVKDDYNPKDIFEKIEAYFLRKNNEMHKN
jgi:molybdopterin-guanine dinucleotide biosynthesis protein MobB